MRFLVQVPTVRHSLSSLVTFIAILVNLVEFRAAATGAAPTITAIENNYSYLIPGNPNYGIAPGTLFIVRGTGLAAAGAQPVLWSFSQGPLPGTAAGGTSISVTVGGTTVTPGLYYFSDTQLAAVLPSNVPVGNGALTVTYNGQTSAAANIVVVASAMGFDTLYGNGVGEAVATDNATGALITYNASASWG